MVASSVREQVAQLVRGFWHTQIVGAVAALGVADALVAGPRTGAELAAELGVNGAALTRLLRAAATLGLFERTGERFALTPMGQTLRSGQAGSLKHMAMAMSAPGHWLPWGRLLEVVRSGESAPRAALGMEVWEWYDAHPDEGAIFSNFMSAVSQHAAAELLAAFDFTGLRVVDVGGAHGALLAAILEAHPDARGVLLDVESTAARAREVFAKRGLAARVECVGGDFFAAVPRGDVYVLKHILHDWSDAQCHAILAACAASAPAEARLLVLERLLPDDDQASVGHLMDINMMVMLTGRERTCAELGALLAAAGWRLAKHTVGASGLCVMEAVRA